MSIDLKSGNGSEISLSPRYWSFFLCLAETCEWKPQGTKKPKGYGFFRKWTGSYESCEGQIVNSQDAQEFSKGLNRCFYSKHCFEIMEAVNTSIETKVQESTKASIPEEMKIKINEELKKSLGKLIAFTNQGEFSIS